MEQLKAVQLLFLILFAMNSAVHAQSAFNVYEASISEIQEAMDRNEVSAVQLVEQYLQRIAAYDKNGPALNSIIRINSEALEQARALDVERQASGPRSMLHGIPIVLKDNYNTIDMPTTAGSVALAGFRPAANATQVDRLLDAGAVIIAKTNLHEFAYGITTVGSLLGQTRNPYDPRRVPGGSSGGTGAAVAASFAAAGFGSDTCGSIRIPSAFNNLIGLRPSKGLSSIYGVLPLSHTQDVAGPLARNSMDLALILDQVVGFDARDEATQVIQHAELPTFVADLKSADLSSLRIGKLVDYFVGADTATHRVLDEALEWFEEQGSEVIDIEAQDLRSLIAASALIGYEFEVDLNSYLQEFSDGEARSLELVLDRGLHHEAVSGVLNRSSINERDEDAYQTALGKRKDLRDAIESILDQYEIDILVYPPIAQTAVQVGESQPGNNCSLSANSGLPALSMPAGMSPDGLPVGMELLGGFLQDAELLAIAYAFEQERNVRVPPPTAPALIDGEVPGDTQYSLSIDERGVSIAVDVRIDRVTNELGYSLRVAQGSAELIHAITLAVAGSSQSAEAAMIQKNLLGPEQAVAAGKFFMNPLVREAAERGDLFLRIFAQPFPSNGLSWKLE